MWWNIGKIQRTAGDADDFQANKIVTLKPSPGAGMAARWVIKKATFIPKAKYPINSTNSDKTLMGSGPPKESTANPMENWIDAQLIIYQIINTIWLLLNFWN